MADRLMDIRRRESRDVNPLEPPASLSRRESMTDIIGRTLSEGDPKGPPVSVRRREQHSPSKLNTLSYTNNIFDKEEREVKRTAQTPEQWLQLTQWNKQASVVNVERPRKGHGY